MAELYRQYLMDLYNETKKADKLEQDINYVEDESFSNEDYKEGERYKIINLSDDFKLESIGKYIRFIWNITNEFNI